MNNEKKLCRKCKMEIDKNAKRCPYCNTKPHSKVAIIILIILIFFTVIYPIYEWWYYKYYVTEKVRRDYSMNIPSIVYQIDEVV
ncbi:MAG: hypothetical protein UEY44_07990 [Coprococcus sp.]|nr:hypothetical protein [Coprococcus sp.]